MSELINIKNGEVQIVATSENEQWKKAMENAFAALASELEIEGYEKGNIPFEIAKEQIKGEEIIQRAVSTVANEMLTEAIEEHQLQLVAPAELKINEVNEQKCVLEFICTITPEIKLGDYEQLSIECSEVTVEDYEVEVTIHNMLQRSVEWKHKENQIVENGDQAIIDFKGLKDGVAFEGGTSKNYPLEIGSKSFIPGFEEQLIGMKAEEKRDIHVTFPENYPSKDLAGQPVIFEIVCHEIKQKQIPVLSDDFIASMGNPAFATVEQFKNYIKTNLIQQKQQKEESKAANELLNKLAELVEVEIPEAMLNAEFDAILNEYQSMLAQQGATLEQYFAATGDTLENMKQMMLPQALTRIKSSLALEQIAREKGFVATSEEVENQLKELAEMYHMTNEQILSQIHPSLIEKEIIRNKSLDYFKK